MNISQPSESKTLKCPTCLQNRRHVAPSTRIFHKLEFIKREKFINQRVFFARAFFYEFCAFFCTLNDESDA